MTNYKYSALFAAFATILMVTNVIGFYRGEKISPGGFGATITALEASIDELGLENSDAKKMDLIYDFVINRFDHSGDPSPSYSFYSNYLLYTAGLINPEFSRIRDPNYLLQQRSLGSCSELSYIMVAMAENLNIRARHVGLNGHVVMEAYYDNDFHMYDPLYKVKPLLQGNVVSVSWLEKNPKILRSFYQQEISDPKLLESTLSFFKSRDDNSFVSYPPLAQFNWKASVLLYCEICSHYLKWILPVLIFLFLTIKEFLKVKNRG